jgi:molybdopterin converting factor small subunit
MNVCVPSPLRTYTGGVSEVEAAGGSLGAVLEDLDRRYPGIRFRVVDEQDRIRPHVKFFVAGELVATLSAPVGDGAEVHIICALSGG